MSQLQMQERPSIVNGVSRRRTDRDLGNHPESFRGDFQNYRSFQTTRSGTEGSGQSIHQHVNHMDNDHMAHVGGSRRAGDKGEAFPLSGSTGGRHDRPLNERLLFMTACLIGQPVEVQVKNGSIYSGVFHTANAEKDYGVVLKMARVTKDGLRKGGKGDAAKDLRRRGPVKTFIIHAKDLVQIIAKDVPLSQEAGQNGNARENRTEIVTDTFLSQGRHGELERELKPWTPDSDDPKDLGLESTFQSTWNRNWDQFEINKTLFGVESTFDEELYTTKLEKGPQMREREREAWRIAREIEGEATKNLHLAEERGVRLTKELEALDEESRFSSVLRFNERIDIGEDTEDVNVDMHNDETFGDSVDKIGTGLVASIESESSAPKLGDSECRMSSPSSTDLNETKNGPPKRDPSLAVQDHSVATVGREAAAVDSLAGTDRERLQHVVVGNQSKRGIKAGGPPYHSPVGRPSAFVSPSTRDTTSIQALNLDPGCPQVTEDIYREFNEFKQQENAKRGKKQREDQVNELKSFSESLRDLTKDLEPRFPKLSNDAVKNASAENGTRPSALADSKSGPSPAGATVDSISTNVAACTSPASALRIPTETTSLSSTLFSSDSTSLSAQSQSTSSGSASMSTRVVTNNSSESGSIRGVAQLELPSTSGVQPSLNPNTEGSVAPLNSTALATAPSSPSSSSSASAGAPLAKKSSLNPNAKEFKLNPNAKSFTPTFTPRPPSPVVQGPVYVPGGMPPVAPMPGGTGVNPLLQQAGQSASKFAPYNSMAVAAASGGTPFLQAPGAYTPAVSGTIVPPALGGQSTLKMPPQVQQPVVGHSFGSQPPIRITSQAPPVQSAPTYLHPNGQMYSQQMMFGQPGQVVYIQPFPQGPPMRPSQPAQAASQQGQQPKHRGGGVQGLPFCIAPPFLAGQQHFLQMPHLHSPLPPTPGVLAPTTMPGIQPPQGVVTGMVPTMQNTGLLPGTNAMRVGGKVSGGNF